MKIVFVFVASLVMGLQSALAGGACCAAAKSEQKETAKASDEKAEACESSETVQKQTPAKTADAEKVAKAE